MDKDVLYMKAALKEAEKAMGADEVPVGAVLVYNGQIIARGFNQVETLKDATAHAEMIVITSAMNHIGAKYLKDCVLYVTLEPCLMCAGAIQLSKLAGVVYGANDEKMGFSQKSKNAFSKAFKIKGGVLHEESTSLLKAFFKAKR